MNYDLFGNVIADEPAPAKPSTKSSAPTKNTKPSADTSLSAAQPTYDHYQPGRPYTIHRVSKTEVWLMHTDL